MQNQLLFHTQMKTALRSLLLQLQVERKVKPPRCDVASLGITVHAGFLLR